MLRADSELVGYSRATSRDVGSSPDLGFKYLAIFVLADAAFLAASAGNVYGQGCAFNYQFSSNGAVYPGGTFTIYNSFSNTGSVDIQITSVELRFDFATYDASSSSGLPLTVSVGSSRSLYFDIQIPSDTSVGNHTLTVIIGVQCYESGSWVTPGESPVYTSTQTIGQNPTVSASIVQTIYGVTIAGAVAVAGIIGWIMLKRTRAPPPPEPSYMPSLPPSETPRNSRYS